MSLAGGTDGLALEQAPPLAIPASFFVAAPLGMFAAGLLLLFAPEALTVARQLPLTVAATHLGTVGWLTMVMFGALYQMIPVVAGAPVPGVRAAHAVHAGLVATTLALVWGFATEDAAAHWLALQALILTFLGFLAPVAWALWRAPTRSDTVTGMRVAVTGLLGLVVVGVLLTAGRATGLFRGDWDAWLAVHVALGLVVWVGGLLTAVSWQVVPMFYLAEAVPAWARRATLGALVVTAVAAPVAAFGGAGREAVVWCAAPGAIAVWLLNPALLVRSLVRRRRRRADESVRFWYAGMVAAPLVLAAAAASVLGDGSGWPIAFGWLAIWGWAGLVVHGMLTRIVPFLVWFHRFSGLVGIVKVPSMKALWPAGRARVGWLAHVAAVAFGVAAIAGGDAVSPRVAGGLLVVAAGVLFASIIGALRARGAGGDSRRG